jgi:hypothetical protein
MQEVINHPLIAKKFATISFTMRLEQFMGLYQRSSRLPPSAIGRSSGIFNGIAVRWHRNQSASDATTSFYGKIGNQSPWTLHNNPRV